MISLISLVLGLALFVVSVLWTLQKSYIPRMIDYFKCHTPPGPVSYPLVGARGIDSKKPWKTFAAWGKKYGGFYSTFIGTEYTLMLTDIATIRLAMNNASFDGRPTDLLFRKLYGNKGIGFADGPDWKVQRRFLSLTLRNLGAAYGRLELNEIFQNITANYIESFRLTNSQAFFVRPYIEKAVVAGVSRIFHQGQLTPEDANFPRLVQAITQFFSLNFNTGLLNVIPWLRYIPPFRQRYLFLKRAGDDVVRFARHAIREKERHSVGSPAAGPTDVVEAFRLEQDKSDHDPSFTDEQLVLMTAELVMAGSEDLINLFTWVVFFTAFYPEEQKRVQEEIERMVGRQTISLKDRGLLGYTEAFILECIRFSNAVPYPLPQRALENVSFMGYTVPKDTIIMTNAYAVHVDKELWGDPQNFRPNRFIDTSTGKFVASQNILTFGFGRRNCIGEAYTKMKMFMLLASMLQNFNITFPKGTRQPDIEDVEEGAMFTPPPFEICAIPR